MEKEADSAPIPDREFLNLLNEVRNKDPEATLQLIELYKLTILRLSQFIHLPSGRCDFRNYRRVPGINP